MPKRMRPNHSKAGGLGRVSALPTSAWVLFLTAVLIVLSLFCAGLGQYSLTIAESWEILFGKLVAAEPTWKPMAESVVLYLRIPRIIAAGIVGAALALSGSVYQGIFRNPLVSPDLLGVSSGACVGAALAILFGLSAEWTQIMAFAAGLMAVGLTLSIPKMLGSTSNIMLVLSGVIVSGLMSSFMGLIKYVADPQSQLQAITFWQMGSFASVKYDELLSVLIPMGIGFVVLFLISWWVDVLAMGETEAKLLGANAKPIRNIAIVCSSVLTASAVCLCGTISWIGLVIPHFARMLVGPNNTKLMPVASLLGAIFMIAVDTCARNISGQELPISILTSLIGAPFYILLMRRQKGELQ